MPETGPPSLIDALFAVRNASRPAVQSGDHVLSRAQLRNRIAETAMQIKDTGLQPGDRALVLYPNGIEHLVATFAVIACGAIAIPLAIAGRDRRIVDVAQQTGARLCLAPEGTALPAGLETPGLSVMWNGSDEHPVATGMESRDPGRPLTEDPATFIRFTSGSTGEPKGVVITRAQQLWITRQLVEHFGIGPDHRELLFAPMALSGGWQRVAATLAGGGCVVIGEWPLSVSDLLDQFTAYGATGFFTPPPLIRMLLASPVDRTRAALEGCRRIEIGSAVLQAGELEAMMALAPGARVHVHYGLTECPRATILDARAHPGRLTTVGRPLGGVAVSIRDERGLELPVGETGQIHVRGPQCASGYWPHPGSDTQTTGDRWLATGDYGKLDEAGFLSFSGRHDDRINCIGQCFYPAEAEQLLGVPDGVEQYLIAGVADPRGILQEVPWAFVLPARTGHWSTGNFLALARRRLPAHMVPRHIVTVPRLPLTASGKPHRRETVRLYASHTRPVNNGQE